MAVLEPGGDNIWGREASEELEKPTEMSTWRAQAVLE